MDALVVAESRECLTVRLILQLRENFEKDSLHRALLDNPNAPKHVVVQSLARLVQVSDEMNAMDYS